MLSRYMMKYQFQFEVTFAAIIYNNQTTIMYANGHTGTRATKRTGLSVAIHSNKAKARCKDVA